MEDIRKHRVVPDVWPNDFELSSTLTISYPSGAHAKMGNHLTPTQVKDQPTVAWNAESDELFTLSLVDPDAPSRKDPKFREWHHWLVVNIPGNHVSKGQTLSEYIPSAPPKGSGLHRYVFLLFKQNEKINPDEKHLTNRSGDHRGKFSIHKFAHKYSLGDPVGCAFYEAEWDDHVPKVYEQLSGK